MFFGCFGETAVNSEITPVITGETAVITGETGVISEFTPIRRRGRNRYVHYLSTKQPRCNGRGRLFEGGAAYSQTTHTRLYSRAAFFGTRDISRFLANSPFTLKYRPCRCFSLHSDTLQANGERMQQTKEKRPFRACLPSFRRRGFRVEA